MSIKFSAEDVLKYLNELGFTNISAQQLKEFMQDLKKLIKYEERKLALQDFTDDLQSNGRTSTPNPAKEDIFQHLYKQQTEASKAKIIQKKIIEVEIKRRKIKDIDHQQHCIHLNSENVPKQQPLLDNLVSNKEVKSDEIDSEKKDSGIGTSKKSSEDKPDNLNIKQTKKKPSSGKYKAAFIRPCMSKTNKKTDPVALYHKYQEEWKKVNIPGEVSRSRLRWRIRNDMACSHR